MSLFVLPILFILFLLIISNSRLSVYLIISHIFLFEWLNAFWKVIPKEFTWISDFSIFILLVKVLILIGLGKISIRRTNLDKIVLTILFISFVSFIFSDSNIITYLLGLRSYFKYMIFFYCLLYLRMNEDYVFFEKIIGLFIFLIFLQVPVAILQKIFINKRDLICGTLGFNANQELSLILLAGLAFVFGLYMNNIIKNKFLFISCCILLLIPIALNGAKAAFFFLPILLIYISRKRLFDSLSSMINAVLITFVLICAMILLGNKYLDEKVAISYLLTNPDYVAEYMFGADANRGGVEYTKGGSLKRGSTFIYNLKIIKDNYFYQLAGVSPGNGSQSLFANYNGKYYNRKLNNSRIDFTRIILEFGILGTLMFAYLLYKCAIMANFLVDKLRNPFWSSVVYASEGIIILYMLSTLYIPTFLSDTISFWFWFLMVFIVSEYDKLKFQKIENNENFTNNTQSQAGWRS